MITVVGIGEKKDEISVLGKKTIDSARYVVIRTAKQAHGIKFNESLDGLYEKANDYEEFNCLAADRLLHLNKEYGDIVYAVAGDGFCDSSVERLCSGGVQVVYVAGAAQARPAATSFLQFNAYDLNLKPQLDNLPLLVYSLDSPLIASEVKLYLLKFYPYNMPVLFYSGEKINRITLEDLDRQPKYTAFCKAFIHSADFNKESICKEDFSENFSKENGCKANNNKSEFDKSTYTFGDLVRIMERLTAAGGCPWDVSQTHQSIRSNMIEEAYEAVAAIDSGDIDNLIEELGDVMLQSIFHADIARRHGEFDLSDVISTLCRKLYTRHPHVFGDKTASDGAEALKNWEDAKVNEKQANLAAKNSANVNENILSNSDSAANAIKSGVTGAKIIADANEKNGLSERYQGFPSALRAQKILKKLLKGGFLSKSDFTPNFTNTVGKTDFGKLLFDAVAACELNGIDAETELNAYLNHLLKS